ncbi:hypothetical protein LZC95_07940 [Pendulispora brunnea]|uniref:Portal protein n=1 Tax=Pendulispora brunnea TaxID=2905690 RepID=A0ABZ2KDK4_9BACT
MTAREHDFADWGDLKRASELELRLAITMARLPALYDEGMGVTLKPGRARESRTLLRSKLGDVDAALAYFVQNAAVDDDGLIREDPAVEWKEETSAVWMDRINKTFRVQVTPGVVIAAAVIYGAAIEKTVSPHAQFDMTEFRSLPYYGIQNYAGNADDLVRRIHHYCMDHILGFVVPGLNWAIHRWVLRDASPRRLARLEHVVPRPPGPVTLPLSDGANRILLDDEINGVFAYASRQHSYEEVDLVRRLKAETDAANREGSREVVELLASLDPELFDESEDGEELHEEEAAVDAVEMNRVEVFDMFTAEKEELARAFAQWSSVPDTSPRTTVETSAPMPRVAYTSRDLAEGRARNESSFFRLLDEMQMDLRTSTRYSPRTAPALRALAKDLARIMASEPKISPVQDREQYAMATLEAFAGRLEAGEAERSLAQDFARFIATLQTEGSLSLPATPSGNALGLRSD